MTYSILIPLGLHNTNHPRRLLDWWADADDKYKRLFDFGEAVYQKGCNEIVLALPFGTPIAGRQEGDQIRRLSDSVAKAVAYFNKTCKHSGIRSALYTGFGWPNRPWSPFGWRYGTVANDGKWRYPDIRRRADAREVVADLRAAKAIGFDSVWIDQLASVEGELGDEQGSRWAKALRNTTGLGVVGEAHWSEDSLMYCTDMVSLGREIDARRTNPRGGVAGVAARDIAWINGHGTVDGMPDGRPVRTPSDQVEAGRRYQSIGFEVCYEVDSFQTVRGIVEARATAP